MRRTLIAVAVASLALFAVSTSAFGGGGNSANAKLCQKGGWMHLVRADGTAFASETECVSYGAKGGTISPPQQPRTGAEVCAAYGGFFQGLALGALAWDCGNWVVTDLDAQIAALDEACRFDLGAAYDGTYPQFAPEPFRSTDCYRKPI